MTTPRTRILSSLAAMAGAAVAARAIGMAPGEATAAGSVLFGYAAFAATRRNGIVHRLLAKGGSAPTRQERPGEAVANFAAAALVGTTAYASSSHAFLAMAASVAAYAVSDAAHELAADAASDAAQEAARIERQATEEALAAGGSGPEETAPEVGTRWRHLKRGTEYVVEDVVPCAEELSEGDLCLIREGRLHKAEGASEDSYAVQAASPQHPGTVFCAYRGDKGDGWARPIREFADGRFSLIA